MQSNKNIILPISRKADRGNIRRISNIFRTPAPLVMEKWVSSWYWIHTTIARLVCTSRYFITESFMESNKFVVLYSRIGRAFIKLIIHIFTFSILILYIGFRRTLIWRSCSVFFLLLYWRMNEYWLKLLSRGPSIKKPYNRGIEVILHQLCISLYFRTLFALPFGVLRKNSFIQLAFQTEINANNQSHHQIKTFQKYLPVTDRYSRNEKYICCSEHALSPLARTDSSVR